MEKMEAEQKLYEAAIDGSFDLLNRAIGDDSRILDKVLVGRCSGRSPLHVAAYFGHEDFAKRLLELRPELAGILDAADRSALHVAAAQGYVGVAEALINRKPSLCLARDREGMNFLHVAAANGQVKFLEELVSAKPHAARATAGHGETILHLCVKHDQVEALKLLLKMIGDRNFVNAKDAAGDTILHLAVSGEQTESVKLLLDDDTKTEKKTKMKIDVNATNGSEHTAMDIVRVARGEEDNDNPGGAGDDTPSSKIEDLLQQAKAKRAKNLVQGEWVSKKRDSLMVVASLIATMAFQAALNPPGGVWQDTGGGKHGAGESVMAYNYKDSYPWFLRSATVGFVASLSTILLLISGLPMRKKVYMWVLMVIMWLTIMAMAATYAISIVWVTPKGDRSSLVRTIMVAVFVFSGVVAILLVVHTVRLVNGVIRERQSRKSAIDRINELKQPSHRGEVAQKFKAGELTNGGLIRRQPNAQTIRSMNVSHDIV